MLLCLEERTAHHLTFGAEMKGAEMAAHQEGRLKGIRSADQLEPAADTRSLNQPAVIMGDAPTKVQPELAALGTDLCPCGADINRPRRTSIFTGYGKNSATAVELS